MVINHVSKSWGDPPSGEGSKVWTWSPLVRPEELVVVFFSLHSFNKGEVNPELPIIWPNGIIFHQPRFP